MFSTFVRGNVSSLFPSLTSRSLFSVTSKENRSEFALFLFHPRKGIRPIEKGQGEKEEEVREKVRVGNTRNFFGPLRRSWAFLSLSPRLPDSASRNSRRKDAFPARKHAAYQWLSNAPHKLFARRASRRKERDEEGERRRGGGGREKERSEKKGSETAPCKRPAVAIFFRGSGIRRR